MCGRITLGEWDRRLLSDELGVPVESLPQIRPRYNIAPTDEHVIVRLRHEEREVLPARWGLVNSWAGDASRAARQINARAETAAQVPAYRDAFRRRRCVVPVDGFFEWIGPREARRPLWFHRPDGHILLLAGLYESWRPADDGWRRTFTILTTAANDLMRPYHDRMPVILDQDAADRWMDPGEASVDRLCAMLLPAPDDVLAARRVSTEVNSVRNDYPELLREQHSLL